MTKSLEELTRENRKKDVIIDSTHDGLIYVNSNEEIELFNRAAEEIMGLERREVLGRNVQEVIPNTRLHIVLKEGKAELNRQQDTGEGMIITNRVPISDSNGKVIGAIAVFRDITELRKQAEELTNLKEIRVLLEAIINSTQDAISVVDKDGTGIMINPEYTRLTGLTEEDVIGKPATVDIAEGESMHFQVLKTKKPVHSVRMRVGPSRKDVIVNVAPILVDGKIKGSVGVLHDVSEIKRLTEELDDARRMIRQLNPKYTFDDIIGESELIKSVINQARKASGTPATVLLRGESGTGKELFAHAIHNDSERNKLTFIRVNCSALADNLLESELFGYVEGAFTGASKGGKKGLFEEADGGTIFLDEIGKVSTNLQVKLLRVLQEKEITRVGATRPTDVDVRVIVATNTNLEKAIQEGAFREDLYYRLNVFPLFIPPLRERREDIPLLVKRIIQRFNQEYGRSVKGCKSEVVERLISYDWPGNIRELENIIGRAMINLGLEEDLIDLDHLPFLKSGRLDEDFTVGKPLLESRSLKEIIAETEKKVIIQALKENEGNRTEASRMLGIAVRSLYYKMDKYGIE